MRLKRLSRRLERVRINKVVYAGIAFAFVFVFMHTLEERFLPVAPGAEDVEALAATRISQELTVAGAVGLLFAFIYELSRNGLRGGTLVRGLSFGALMFLVSALLYAAVTYAEIDNAFLHELYEARLAWLLSFLFGGAITAALLREEIPAVGSPVAKAA